MQNNQKYSIDEIQKALIPIARKYEVKRIAIFGSYARGEADASSDIDLHLIETGGLWGYFKLYSFKHELEACFGRAVDVLTTGAMDDEVLERVRKEEVLLYEHQ